MTTIYALGSLVLILHFGALISIYYITKKNGIGIGILFAVTIWFFPSIQLYFEDAISAFTHVSGLDSGLSAYQSGRGIIFSLQLIAGLLLAFLWTKKEPNQSLQTTIMVVTDAAAQPPRQP